MRGVGELLVESTALLPAAKPQSIGQERNQAADEAERES